ncbi:MAG: S41 family peptidase [Paludibacter sp.]|nr:S41 family peptidase [Paludibacter sp.]
MKNNLIFRANLLISFLLIIFSANAQNDFNQTKTTRISRNFDIFNSVLRELDLNYVDTLNYDKIVGNAIDYMLHKIDPYTVYIPENQENDLTMMTSGEYAGIGALIQQNGQGQIVIAEPFEGKPAQKNDVRAGDIILSVDGISTKNLTTSQVSEKLKGYPNSLIKLKLQRFGVEKPIEKEFLREKIVMESVSYYAEIQQGTAYILLSDFTDHAAQEVKTALNEMNAKTPLQAVILDLRDNGGGLINEAITILNYFLPKGTTVVTTKGKLSSANRIYKTPVEPIFPNVRLIVLTNNNTASASEIIAGAIQDLDRGMIVGERTYGKGLVQSVRSVSYGGYLKVTTAKYYIPSGRCIQAIDYSHRTSDGSIARVPDSLTQVFNTAGGRKVRDGGGITPDSIISNDQNLNIAYYIYAKNLYFDYASIFVQKHQTVAPPSNFKLSDEDFNDFVKYLKDKNFTYTNTSEKYLAELKNAAKFDGVAEQVEAELDALQKKLKPDLDSDIQAHKADIVNLLSSEIMRRYYFQKGEIIFSLQDDKQLKTALEILNNSLIYNKILNKN